MGGERSRGTVGGRERRKGIPSILEEEPRRGKNGPRAITEDRARAPTFNRREPSPPPPLPSPRYCFESQRARFPRGGKIVFHITRARGPSLCYEPFPPPLSSLVQEEVGRESNIRGRDKNRLAYPILICLLNPLYFLWTIDIGVESRFQGKFVGEGGEKAFFFPFRSYFRQIIEFRAQQVSI